MRMDLGAPKRALIYLCPVRLLSGYPEDVGKTGTDMEFERCAAGYSGAQKKRLVGPEWNVLVDNLDLVSLRGVDPDFGPIFIAGRSRETDRLTHV